MENLYNNMSRDELILEIIKLKSEIKDRQPGRESSIYEDLLPNAGYVYFDKDGRVFDANSTALKMLNDGNPFDRKLFSDIIIKEDKIKYHEHLKKLNNGSSKEFVEFEVKKKGNVKYFSAESVPVSGISDNEITYRMVLTDISEKRNLEDKVEYNEKRLEAIFNQVIVGILQIDLSGNILLVNKKFCEITGRPEHELLKMNIKEITYHEDINQKTELLAKLSPENPFITYQKRYIRSDNTIVWVHNSMTLVTDQNGKRKYAVALVEDISDRMKIEESLRKSMKELSDYKYAIDESSIVAITDQKGLIKYANDNFCKISKYTRDELLGKDHRIINSGYHPKEFIRNLWKTIASGKIWKGELRNKAKDGSIYWVDTTIVPFVNEKNKPFQYVAIRSDITQKKFAEEKIKESEERFRVMADITPAFIWITNSLGSVIYMNKTRVEFCGSVVEDQLGDKWINYVYPDERTQLVQIWKESIIKREKFQVEYRLRTGDGSYRWILDTGLPRFSYSGEFMGFIGSGIDINEIKEYENKLRESYEREKKLRIATEEGERKLSFIAEATTILNSSLDYSFTLKSLAHMAVPDIADWCIVDLMEDNTNELRRVAISHTASDSTGFTDYLRDSVNTTINDFTGEWDTIKSGTSLLYKTITDDIKKILAKDDEHYRILIKLKMKSGMIVPLKIREKVFGCIILIYAESDRYYDEDDLHFVEDLASRAALAIDNARLYNESQQLNKNLQERVKELQYEIHERIKARKDLMASEERFRQLAENITNVFFIVDYKTGEIVYLSPAFISIWGISPSIVYKDSFKLLDIIHPDDKERISGKHGVKFLHEEFNEEFRILKNGGIERWIHTKSFPVLNDKGEIYRIVGVTEDITRRKLSEEQIKQSLREKEVLLREIHHRVKNNLQIISSLLSLQTPNIKNKKDLEIFMDSQNRIRSMALVHEKLYQRKDISGINFEEYVKELTNILKDSYRIKAEFIEFKIDVDDIMLNIDLSIGLGLIINELVSNAFKHAFPGNVNGLVEIIVKSGENNSLFIRVADNGVGIPENIDFRNTDSLGLQLVTTLVEQHGGKVELSIDVGTVFDITFPELKHK